MASKSETGNGVNVANFKILTNACTGYGPSYQPTEDRLKLETLNSLHTASAAAQAAVAGPDAAYTRANSERGALYEPLSKLTTRIIRMFKVTKALPNVKDNAKTIADKIRGMNRKRKPGTDTPPAPGETPEDTTHSTSQRSFTMMAENLELLIAILAAEPTYSPAEEDLKVSTLQQLLTDMRTKNNETDLAYQALRTVRTERNRLLYTKGTGLVDTALDVKLYVSAAFGTSSSQFKEIKGLKFTRIGEDPNK